MNIEDLIAELAETKVVPTSRGQAMEEMEEFVVACRRDDEDPREQQRISDIAELIEAEDTIYTQAIAAVERGDHYNALPLLRLAAEEGSGDAAWLLATVLEERGQLEDAVTWYQRAADDGDSRADTKLAELHLRQANPVIGLVGEVPDVSYNDIGGLGPQIEQIRDAIELPYLHADLFRQYGLRPAKGVLLYGPPGCGKTLIAKAVANSLAKQVAAKAAAAELGSADVPGSGFLFLNINGPELLSKHVGEAERHIRLVFQRAREKASEGTTVIVFFDEMDSIFRTRDSEAATALDNTTWAQLLSEIDGVAGLQNLIVIGATNREDLIDPALLRPGRLDTKIKIGRPDAEAAIDIFSKYVVPDLPLHPDELAEHSGSREATVKAMIWRVVERMYSESEENRFLEVTYHNGDKEILYFRQFNSGAMIESIVARAKKMAIKEFLETGRAGLRVAHLLASCVDEFSENEDLPNTTSPDDWARISGRKGDRIVYIRTLVSGKSGKQAGRSIAAEFSDQDL